MSEPVIRPMLESDLDAADRVHRIAFGTRFGLPDPSKFRGDAQIVRPRWAIEPDATIVAQIDGTIVGGACAMGWGSVFIVGPIFVHPDQAGRGLARLLVRELIASYPVYRTYSRAGEHGVRPADATYISQAMQGARERLPDGNCRIRFRATNDQAPPKPEGFVRMDKMWGEWRLEAVRADGNDRKRR